MDDAQPNSTSTGSTPEVPGSRFGVWTPLLVIGLMGAASLAGTVYLLRTTGPQPSDSRDLAQEARADLERRKFRPLSEPLERLLADAKYRAIPTQAHPLLLSIAADFALADIQDKSWSLAQELKNGPVVLVFYYGYHCDHCVSQLFALDKDIDKFRELGVNVVAVSADPPELTRERFRQYGAFQFPVLSDPGNKIAEKYGTYAPSKQAGEEGEQMHGTFIIDRQGKVVWANRGDSPFTENRSLLLELARIEGRLPGKSLPGR